MKEKGKRYADVIRRAEPNDIKEGNVVALKRMKPVHSNLRLKKSKNGMAVISFVKIPKLLHITEEV